MTGCLFCSIVSGEGDGFVVSRSPVAVAFLDVRPVFKGHTLVVPVAHVPTLTDLPPEAVGPYFAEVRRVTTAVQSALDADGSFVAVNNTVSQSVPHLHTHVVPRRRKDGLRGFFWPRTRYTDDAEAAGFAARIAAALLAGDAD